MQKVFIVRGKAKHVFTYVELLNRYKGNTTLVELAKTNKTIKLDLR